MCARCRRAGWGLEGWAGRAGSCRNLEAGLVLQVPYPGPPTQYLPLDSQPVSCTQMPGETGPQTPAPSSLVAEPLLCSGVVRQATPPSEPPGVSSVKWGKLQHSRALAFPLPV